MDNTVIIRIGYFVLRTCYKLHYFSSRSNERSRFRLLESKQ